jgi:2-oxoisovalerate dehydrogenase E1 component
VIFLEPKALFSSKGPVPVGEHFVPFGLASVVRQGTDLTIVTCGSPVHRCLDAAARLAADGVSCEIVDLRTVVPLDVETIVESVGKTGRLLVVDEGFAMCGLGAEIAAVAMEHAFESLYAPVGRLHTDPVGHPFSPAHENAVVVSVERILSAAKAVLAGQPEIPRRLVGSKGHRSENVSPSPSQAAKIAPTAASGTIGETASKVPGVALVMPNQDLTITEARVVQWLKQVGDPVAAGEPVVEVETDKAVATVDSPLDGLLVEIAAPVDAVVLLGARLGTIRPKD